MAKGKCRQNQALPKATAHSAALPPEIVYIPAVEWWRKHQFDLETKKKQTLQVSERSTRPVGSPTNQSFASSSTATLNNGLLFLALLPAVGSGRRGHCLGPSGKSPRALVSKSKTDVHFASLFLLQPERKVIYKLGRPLIGR